MNFNQGVIYLSRLLEDSWLFNYNKIITSVCRGKAVNV